MKALRVSRKATDAVHKRIQRKYLENTATHAAYRKDYQLQYRYGIGLNEYQVMLEEQNYRCAICERPRTVDRDLAVDHEHESRVVRGLLCGDCNRSLGGFQDNPSICRKAAAYLELYSNLIGKASLETDAEIAKSSSLDSSESNEVDLGKNEDTT